MWKEIIVKKPRKTYKCGLCFKTITGQHNKVVVVQNGDFHCWREHLECNTTRHNMCNKCEYNNDCQTSLTDCFQEYCNNQKT